jgi:hypothetical protein
VATRELKILLTLKDEVSKNLKGLEKRVDAMQPAFTGMAAAGAVAFGGITAGIMASVNAAKDAEVSQARLAQILKTSVDATDAQIEGLMLQAKALERVGVVSGEATQAAMGTLATFDLQAESIQKLIPSFLNMVVAEKGVNATTDDMIGLANGLGKVLQGQVGALSRQGFVFDEATEALLKNGTEMEKVTALAAILDSTYAGLNERMRDTTAGGIKGMQFALDDLQEQIGTIVAPIIVGLVNDLTPLVSKLGEWVQTNPELTKQIVLWTAGLSGALMMIGLIGKTLPTVIALVQALTAAFAFLAANPISVALMAIVAALGLIAKAAYDAGKALRDAGLAAEQSRNSANEMMRASLANPNLSPETLAKRNKMYNDTMAMASETERLASMNGLQALGFGFSSMLGDMQAKGRSLIENNRSGGQANMSVVPPSYSFTFNGDVVDRDKFINDIEAAMNRGSLLRNTAGI